MSTKVVNMTFTTEEWALLEQAVLAEACNREWVLNKFRYNNYDENHKYVIESAQQVTKARELLAKLYRVSRA